MGWQGPAHDAHYTIDARIVGVGFSPGPNNTLVGTNFVTEVVTTDDLGWWPKDAMVLFSQSGSRAAHLQGGAWVGNGKREYVRVYNGQLTCDLSKGPGVQTG